jgi:hypothetical protein
MIQKNLTAEDAENAEKFPERITSSKDLCRNWTKVAQASACAKISPEYPSPKASATSGSFVLKNLCALCGET